MVTRLDRLARSTRDLLNILGAIGDKGAGFRSLSDAWADTTTPHLNRTFLTSGLRSWPSLPTTAGVVSTTSSPIAAACSRVSPEKSIWVAHPARP